MEQRSKKLLEQVQYVIRLKHYSYQTEKTYIYWIRRYILDMTKDLIGKLFGDRGYISQKLFEELYERGLQLVTKSKKKMKNRLVKLIDKILLRKRAVIESVNDHLKNLCQIEHSRHRSIFNFLVNLMAGLAAYTYLPQKPSLDIYPKDLPALPPAVF